jgi:hypothetical protein
LRWLDVCGIKVWGSALKEVMRDEEGGYLLKKRITDE